jgi:hypothetical protein
MDSASLSQTSNSTSQQPISFKSRVKTGIVKFGEESMKRFFVGMFISLIGTWIYLWYNFMHVPSEPGADDPKCIMHDLVNFEQMFGVSLIVAFAVGISHLGSGNGWFVGVESVIVYFVLTTVSLLIYIIFRKRMCPTTYSKVSVDTFAVVGITFALSFVVFHMTKHVVNA